MNSRDFQDVYTKLNVDLNKLGCVMLDIEMGELPFIYGDVLYSSDKYFWINGYTASKCAHCTLLYGLLENAYEWKDNVDSVLAGWTIDEIEFDEVSYFDSNLPDAEYYCIIGKVKVTDALREGNDRLKFLPHIDTFANYIPHVTLAYVKKDELHRDQLIKVFSDYLVGKKFPVKGLNYGDRKPVE